ncbi:MAG TPA: hypothetical protein VIJ59_04245, partial [Caulobacteraceae bacterium]
SMLKRLVAATWAIGLLLIASAFPWAAWAQPDTLAASAKVEAALQNIVSRARPGQEGFATIWDGDKYVQCGRPPDGGLRCEAAGSRLQPSLEHVLTPERSARIAALGWRIDPAFGNYAQQFSDKIALAAVAQTLLTTLADGYDAKIAGVEVETRWIAGEPCPPRNGFSQNLAGMVNDAPAMAATAIHACWFAPPAKAGAPTASVDALVARYQPEASAEIQRLRVNAKRSDVFVVFDAGIGYFQCVPETDPAAIYCEAQSADSWSALTSVLTPERVARLHAAGFADPGRSPNYSKAYAADQFDDAAITREVLTLLHDVYGYNGGAALEVKTEEDR